MHETRGSQNGAPSMMLLAAILIGLFILGMLLGPIAMGVCLVVGTVASLIWTVRTVHHVRSRHAD